MPRNNKHPARRQRRHGFLQRSGMTLVEVMATLAILGIVAVIVAQCLVWSLRERIRMSSHQAALELAANVLEAARAQPWEKLDQSWADAQAVPPDMSDLLPEGKVAVKVEPGRAAPQSRNVTVEVHWLVESHLPPHSVRLTTVLSERAKKAGGKS
jgi:prepilin-type N-terminal cleavage/methylation domain-containing protein